MNRTLFDCGIKKQVETKRGQLFDVTTALPRSVKLPSKPVRCDICQESFSAKKYLETHVRFKHNRSENSINLFNLGNDVTECAQVQEREETSKETAHSDSMTKPIFRKPQAAAIDKTEKRWGCNRRKSYTVDFKLKTVQLLQNLGELNTKKKWEKVAEMQGISKSLVVKWHKSKEKLELELKMNRVKKNAGSVKEARKRRKLVCEKSKDSERYPLAAERVVSEFKFRRAGGCKVSKIWLRSKMKAKIEFYYGKEAADKFKGSKNWFQRFKKRHRISLRRRANKKKNSANDGKERIQQFHKNLRNAVNSRRRRTNSSFDAKYGRWLPKNRYNVDQVPLPFVVEQDKTYDVTGNKQVWVSQPSTGLDKRQATLQLCIRAEGEQNVKPAIVFRGKGNITSAEKAQHDKGVDVYFQKCAWMDADLNMEWVSRTLIPGVGNSPDEKVIFADNVGFQQDKEFHQVCRKKMNAVVYLLPENHTDKVQPIDAGCGKMMKTKIGEAMERWLEEDENLEMWHDKLSAKKRRILMTKWTAAAWKELSADQLLFKRLFQKTGCLITADGSDDSSIRPQGLESYEF